MAYEYIEYPRHLHGPHGAVRVVQSDAEKAEALADGWSLTPVLGDEAPLARGGEPAPPAAEAAPVETLRRKRKGKAKAADSTDGEGRDGTDRP